MMKLTDRVFWTLTILIVLLVLGVAGSTTAHLASLVRTRTPPPPSTVQNEALYADLSKGLPAYERGELFKALMEANLSGYSAQQRYEQGRLLVAARTWLRYTGMLLGCLLMTLGLIYSMLQLRKYDSTLEADSHLVKLKLVSASPGLILVVIAVVLVITAMVSNSPVTIVETTPSGGQNQVAQ
jgi:hypothetical protein